MCEPIKTNAATKYVMFCYYNSLITRYSAPYLKNGNIKPPSLRKRDCIVTYVLLKLTTESTNRMSLLEQ